MARVQGDHAVHVHELDMEKYSSTVPYKVVKHGSIGTRGRVTVMRARGRVTVMRARGRVILSVRCG